MAMIGRTVKLTACMLALFLIPIEFASASYFPPREVEKYWFVSNSWKIVEKSSGNTDGLLGGPVMVRSLEPEKYALEVQHGKRSYSFPINRFLMAHYTNSNSICTGSYKRTIERYIVDLKKVTPRPDVLVRVSSAKAKGTLMVAELRNLDTFESWDRVIQEGSHILDLSAEKVRKFGSASAYKSELAKKSLAQWALIEAR